jgi:hypothetical protein
VHPPGSPRLAAVLIVGALLGAGCGDEGSGNVQAFCATARRFEVDNPAAALTAADPADPSGTARALRAAADRLQPWAEEAPSEVRADVEVLRDAAVDLAEAFEAPTVDAATVAELEATYRDVEAAGRRVVEAVRDECGVDLDPVAGADAGGLPPLTTGG